MNAINRIVIRLMSLCLVGVCLLAFLVWRSLSSPFPPASAQESVRPAKTQPSATWFTPLPSSFRLAAARPRVLPQGATIVVTSTTDSDTGSLRQALLSAIPGDNIIFDTAVFPPTSPATITLLSALPEISLGSLTIDASNAGVVLDGRYTASGTSGLRVTSSDNTIKGLQIIRFPNHGIEVTSGATRNLIGGDWTVGSAPHGEGNIITLNGGDGVDISGSGTMSNTVSGNLIGVDADGTRDIRIQAMAISPNYANDQTLFVGTKWHGVWKTTDGGGGWVQVSSGLTISDVRALAVSPAYITDTTVFAGTANGGIFRSINGSTSWTQVDGGVTAKSINALAISPNYASDSQVFAGTEGNGLFASINGGTTWAARTGGLSSNSIKAIACSPNYGVDRTIFVATWNGVFKSINQGYNWTLVSDSRFTEIVVVAVSPNYSNDQTVFATATRCSGGIMWKTTDGGSNWAEVGGSSAGCGMGILVPSPDYANDQTLFAGGGFSSIYKSTSGGTSWSQVWSGHGSLTALSISPAYAQDHTLLATYYNGYVFKTTDSGNTFADIRAGLTEAGNMGAGVMINSGAQWNVIGGDSAGARNVIGHNLRGVDIHDSGTDYNTVSANYIGVDTSGSATLGNDQDGVYINNSAQYNLVGGTMAGERNIISGNSQRGVQIQGIGTMSNTVSGNYIGTDASGTVSLGNTWDGIIVADGAEYNRVGGATAEERNVISGGVGRGVDIENAGYNIVTGNYIGTDVSGANALGNGGEGVMIGCQGAAGGWHNVIEHNVISSNGAWGVIMNGGIAAYDDAPLLDDISLQFNGGPNQLLNGDFSGGLMHWSTWGNSTATRSINNATYHSSPASYQFNRGERSGTLNTFYDTLTQTMFFSSNPSLPSSSIWIAASPGNEVTLSYWYSGTIARAFLLGLDNTGTARNLGARNLAASTTWTQDIITTTLPADIVAVGVQFDVDSIRTVHNVVRNNYIGTDASGTIPMGNNGPGVRLGLGARYNTIGEGNVIVYNLANGIDIRDSATLYNTITRNSIHSNSGQGIDLSNGGNTELSPPALTNATETSVSGIAPMANVIIEIFSDDANQGRIYEGFVTAGSDRAFTFTKPTGLSGPYLTATATDGQGNTSEFSNRIAKPGPTPTATTPPLGPTATPGGPTPTPTPTPTATPLPSGGDSFESDDTCAQAQVVLSNGTIQNHSFHQQADVDWTTFNAISGTTYMIEAQIPPDSPADVSLSVYDSCSGLRQGGQDFSFSPGVRLSFMASATGPLYLRLENHDPNRYGAQVAYQLSVRALGDAPQPGALIIVAGRTRTDDPLQSNIYHVTDAVRDVFLRQGYNDSRIYYLAPENIGTYWDDYAEANKLQAAITTWALDKVAADRALTLYLMDHGDRNLIYLDKVRNEWVTPAQLDAWLTELENAVPSLKVNVILEACYSGSFIEPPEEISKEGRVIVTSTGSGLLAHASSQGALFSDHFLAELDQRRSLYESFQLAAWAVQEARPYGDQTPWLDDNGDGIADTGDGNEAMQRGFAYAGTFADEEWSPYIQQATGPESVSGGKGVIQAKVLDDRGVDMVWAVIYPPSYQPPAGGTEIVKEVLSTIVLLELGGGWYGANYPGFTEVGQYRMVVYAKDDDGLEAQPVTIGLQVGYAVYLPVALRSN